MDDGDLAFQLAEMAMQRYDDAKRIVRRGIVHLDGHIAHGNRCFISKVYKKSLESRRSSWSNISELRSEGDSSANFALIDIYLKEIGREICDICTEFLELIDEYLLPNANTFEANVFYRKIRGDYYRYMIEISCGERRKEYMWKSECAYVEALTIAQKRMLSTHPVRLHLVLSCAILYEDLLEEPEKAKNLAVTTLEDAMPQLDDLDAETRRESMSIIQIIRKNLSL